jgi:hypothetical protein
MTLYDLASNPEIARLIELLYEGYQMPYEEILKKMNIRQKKLNELLDATEGLWDTPSHHSYRLTERGEVVYGIIKSRNVKIKNNRDVIEKEISEMPMEKLKTRMSPVKRFIDTWKAVISKPSTFFENMPIKGGYAKPLKFVLICYIPFAIFTAFLYTGISGILFAPLFLLSGIIGVFILSAVVHLGVRIFANQNNKGFEATTRIISYTSAVVVFTWVPVVGFIPGIYGIYIGLKGLINVHKTTRIRAVFAYFGIITFIGIISAVVAIYLIYTGMAETSVTLPVELPEMPDI